MPALHAGSAAASAHRRTTVLAAEAAIDAIGLGVVAARAERLQVVGVAGEVGALAPALDMVDVCGADGLAIGGAGPAVRFPLQLRGAERGPAAI